VFPQERENVDKIAGTIHWVSDVAPDVEPLKVEFRDYDTLFLSENPSALGDNWLSDLNPDSLRVRHGFADPSVKDLKEFDKVQFERLGFYCLDKNSTPSKLVFNRTVTLKESKWKKDRKK